MEVGSAIQRSKWDAHKREFDDHDISLLRSGKMLIRSIVESGGMDGSRTSTESHGNYFLLRK